MCSNTNFRLCAADEHGGFAAALIDSVALWLLTDSAVDCRLTEDCRL